MKDRVCEQIKNGEVCGKPPYSWSSEHDNLVLCRKCYDDFLKPRKIDSAKKLLSQFSKDEVKEILGVIEHAR